MLDISNYSLTINSENRRFSLHNLNLSIQEGECVLLKGRNGSGKTTILKAISKRLDKKTISEEKGEINYEGKDLPDDLVSYLNIESDTIPSLTVYEHLLISVERRNNLFLINRKKYQNEIINFYDSYLHDSFGLFEYCDSFSKGQKMLLLISMVLINTKKIILLDEPTANLDHKNRQKILELLKAEIIERKLIAIVVSHDSEFDLLMNCTELKIVKEGNTAYIPISNELTQHFPKKQFEGMSESDKKQWYHNFVEVASDNWVFGDKMHKKEIQILDSKFAANQRILISGCGVGREAKYLMNQNRCLNITCLDISKSMMKKCIQHTENRLSYVIADMTKLSKIFISDHFDLIICLGNTIGAFDPYDLEQYASECYEILNDSGVLVMDATLASTKTFDYYKENFDCFQEEMIESNHYGLFIDYPLNKQLNATLYQHYYSTKYINSSLSKYFRVDSSATYQQGYERVICEYSKIASR